MKLLLAAAITLTITASAAQEKGTFTVSGDMTCDNNGIIVETIIKEYKEKPFMFGLVPGGINVVLVINEKTKTWTILAIKDKMTCILAVGTDLTIFEDKRIKHHVVN